MGTKTYIYCNFCADIVPLMRDRMTGTDASGKFIKPTDLMCSKCHYVIATVYKKGPPMTVEDYLERRKKNDSL